MRRPLPSYRSCCESHKRETRDDAPANVYPVSTMIRWLNLAPDQSCFVRVGSEPQQSAAGLGLISIMSFLWLGTQQRKKVCCRSQLLGGTGLPYTHRCSAVLVQRWSRCRQRFLWCGRKQKHGWWKKSFRRVHPSSYRSVRGPNSPSRTLAPRWQRPHAKGRLSPLDERLVSFSIWRLTRLSAVTQSPMRVQYDACVGFPICWVRAGR